MECGSASDERARLLFRHCDDAHPSTECVRTGAAVLLPDVAATEHGWRSFVAEARKVGFASVYALPMRFRSVTRGVLGLFGARSDSMTSGGIHVAQALADAIMAGIMQRWALHHADVRADQLQQALDSRVVIEQAKGVVSQCGSIEVDEAFCLLRRYARSHHQSLHDLATRLVCDRALARDVLHRYRQP